MRPSKTSSRIPQAGSKSAVGSGDVGTPPRASSTSFSPSTTPSSSAVASSSSRLPLSPSPGPPKFQSFKKPAASPATPSEPQPQPLLQNESAMPLLGAADVGQDASTPRDEERSGPSTPEAEVARPSATKTSAGKDGATEGDSVPTSGATVAQSLDGAMAALDTLNSVAAASNPLVASTSGPGASDARPVTGAQQCGQLQSSLEPLQKRLEGLLRGVEMSAAGPEAIQALAAAIVSACKDDAKAAAEAAVVSSRRARPGVAVVTACGATAVCLAALAACMTWVVWVLVDRQIIGPLSLLSESYQYFQ